jgi:alkylated DNA nucleotide flippase Atl1
VKVCRLFRKLPGDVLEECKSLELHKGLGIEGDKNAAVGSPRQVLMIDVKTLDSFDLKPGNLYENILLDEPIQRFVSGQLIQIGDALIRPTFLCEPCSTLEELRPGLAKQIKGKRGFLGMVIKSGRIQIDDEAVFTDYYFPPLSEHVRERFEQFVSRIPVGKVVRTSDLILALGVTKSYYRVIPTWLKKAASGLPVHRIVAIDGRLFTQHLPRQRQLLTQEGIEFVVDRVIDQYYWQPQFFYADDSFINLSNIC